MVVQTYTVVLKDGTNQSGVQQFCSSAHAKLGMACRSTLQHTVDSVIMQVVLQIGYNPLHFIQQHCLPSALTD